MEVKVLIEFRDYRKELDKYFASSFMAVKHC